MRKGNGGGDQSWEKGTRMVKSLSTMGAGVVTMKVIKEATLFAKEALTFHFKFILFYVSCL
jgi:hypothetical protein